MEKVNIELFLLLKKNWGEIIVDNYHNYIFYIIWSAITCLSVSATVAGVFQSVK